MNDRVLNQDKDRLKRTNFIQTAKNRLQDDTASHKLGKPLLISNSQNGKAPKIKFPEQRDQLPGIQNKATRTVNEK